MKKLATVLVLLSFISACAPAATPTPPPTPTNTPAPKISDSFRQRMDSFISAGSAINAMSETGINYQEMGRRFGDMKGAYDIVVSTWPDGLDKSPQVNFDKAVQGWNLTLNLWSMKIKDQDNPAEPDINGYKIFMAYAGEKLVLDKHGADFIVADYRGKKFLPFDENISVLLGMAGNYFTAGRAAILAVLP